MQLAATSTADVTFTWFGTASITNGMPSWAVASKMSLLPKRISETTGIRGILSDVVAGPANICFRWFRTLWTGVDEVLVVLYFFWTIPLDNESDSHPCYRIVYNDSLVVAYPVPFLVL